MPSAHDETRSKLIVTFYKEFENQFRGSRKLIKDRFEVYLPFIKPLFKVCDSARAIDLGCGRGEWLEVLAEQGFAGVGVDADRGMLAEGRAVGLVVHEGDAIEHLKQSSSDTFALISGFHIAEHLPFAVLRTLIAEAHRCLAPGGLLILETPNTENLRVAGSTFFLDPTHERPLPHELLAFAAEYEGFERTKVLRLNESRELRDSAAVTLFEVLTGPSPDCAVIAQKAGGPPSLPLDLAFATDFGLTMVELAARYDAGISNSLKQLKDRLEQLEAQLQHRDPGRLARAIEASKRVAHQKAKEFYWSVTRLVGLGYLHDGSRAWAAGSSRTDAGSSISYDAGPVQEQPEEVALALTRLTAAENALKNECAYQPASGARPRLAYLSPLPPSATGVAVYSAELLSALGRYYEIDAIVATPVDKVAPLGGCSSVKDVAWFEANASRYDRVLYHIGNSHFHETFLRLLEKIPGIVIMHDFYIGDVLYSQDWNKDGGWTRALYFSHGYKALNDLLLRHDVIKTILDCPGNFRVLQQAQGIVVHNKYALELARRFYGSDLAAKCACIPLARALPETSSRKSARAALDIPEDDFIVCSFGFLGRTKLNHRLFESWVGSQLSDNPRCRLVFVGQIGEDEYCRNLLAFMEKYKLDNVRITGFCDVSTYKQYLAAADVAVQLRADSRGETSGTVLDCMAYGLPTIVNCEGSFMDLPDDSVIKLPKDFAPADLLAALRVLAASPSHRAALGANAQRTVERDFSPERSAGLYRAAIENFLQSAGPLFNMKALVETARRVSHQADDPTIRIEAARKLVEASIIARPARQLLVDVSALVRTDLKTGIQRVARAQVLGLLNDPPIGFRVEPVWLNKNEGHWRFLYARRFACGLLDFPTKHLEDSPIVASRGDVYFMPDLYSHAVVEAADAGIYEKLRNAGVTTHFAVYDILPILRPSFFPNGADKMHEAWLHAVAANADQLICISRTVMEETRKWLEKNGPRPSPDLEFLHLGADIDASKASAGAPEEAEVILAKFRSRPTFLQVGTIEPRKGYLQTLQAFERLWRENVDVNLVIVGGEGWKGLPPEDRRTIPQIVERLRNSSENGNRLFWLEGISDEFLETIYESSDCLLATSEDEGFGLPLIEAARHELPILARDIPVFREVAGDHAAYFQGLEPDDVADAITSWLSQLQSNSYPKPTSISWLTWSENVARLKGMLVEAASSKTRQTH